jgi:yersiniabactin synthetase, thioesterase component
VTSSSILRPLLRANDEFAPHLILCPFAGASGSAFSNWRSLIGLNLKISLAVYAGRDHRMKETPATSVDHMADEIASEIAELTHIQQEPILLCGHSMGAQVAFEAGLKLESKGCPPAVVVLSACHAPHLSSRRRLSHRNDQDFISELISIGGCDPLIQEQKSLLTPFLPMLRADFLATESYHRDPAENTKKLNTPALLIYGTNDIEANEEEVSAWSQWTNEYRIHKIAGDHFYVTQRPLALTSKVVEFYFQTSAFSL